MNAYRNREAAAKRSPRQGARRTAESGKPRSSFSVQRSAFSVSTFPFRLRKAFTLVELLVTITVIGILTGVVLGALQAARNTARQSKTKATIAKLHQIITARYDSYRTRRVPMDLVAYATAHQSDFNYNPARPRQLARARLNAIRDLMRMEMPDRWSDVIDPNNPNDPKAVCLVLPAPPALSLRYQRVYREAIKRVSGDTIENYGAAKLLYMIVMSTPEAASQFHNDEIGVIDDSGLPVFLDGWGTPIRFLRWPAGFIPGLYADTNLQSNDPPPPPATTGYAHPDPFDPLRVSPTPDPNADPSVVKGGGYALYPLIYSAGPDKIFDVNVGKDPGNVTHPYQLINGNLDPYAKDGNKYLIGQPLNDDDSSSTLLRHYDNIHNHRIEAR